MSDVVIRVDNLGKRYRIRHQRPERYTALRDVIADKVRGLFRPGRRGAGEQPEVEDFWALKDVSFEVKRGEVIGIIGRNGAGKSTLLKILSRITEPSGGRIELDGNVASLLEVGTGFHPELTGRENIFLNGAILGMARAEIKRKLEEIVAFAEVEKFLDTPVKRYSSGMYVRLAFAVAAHLEPEILIVDEVLAVGDAEFQKKCLGKMRDASRQEGRTVLFVSHNMGAVTTLCNTAIHLDEGSVRAIGPVEGIVARYLGQLLTPETKDLARLRMDGFGDKVRITEIDLVGDQGGNVAYGMPLTIGLTVVAEASMRDMSVGSSIFAENGACVGTLFTNESFSISAGEDLKLELCIANTKLAPGTYYAGFSLGTGGLDGSRTDFDIVIGAPHFHIVPSADTRYVVANWQRSQWGHIVLGEPLLRIS